MFNNNLPDRVHSSQRQKYVTGTPHRYVLGNENSSQGQADILSKGLLLLTAPTSLVL